MKAFHWSFWHSLLFRRQWCCAASWGLTKVSNVSARLHRGAVQLVSSLKHVPLKSHGSRSGVLFGHKSDVRELFWSLGKASKGASSYCRALIYRIQPTLQKHCQTKCQKFSQLLGTLCFKIWKWLPGWTSKNKGNRKLAKCWTIKAKSTTDLYKDLKCDRHLR